MNVVSKITPHLNIVVPLDVETADGKKAVHYVYSQPLPSEVFRAYWMVYSKTFAQIYAEGLHMLAGPRIAAHALRDNAAKMGMTDEVELGVFAQMRRLSYFVLPQEGRGWTQIMLDDAVRGKLISQEDFEEVENILTFFIVTSAMHRGQERRVILEGAARLWDAQITSSGCSEFIASLPKLTETVSSGVKVKVAS